MLDLPYDNEDEELTPSLLDDKYNEDGDGEHPYHDREGWREAVADELTLLGYWEWVAYQISLDCAERNEA